MLGYFRKKLYQLLEECCLKQLNIEGKFMVLGRRRVPQDDLVLST